MRSNRHKLELDRFLFIYLFITIIFKNNDGDKKLELVAWTGCGISDIADDQN